MQTKEISKKAVSSTQRSLKQLEQTTQMAGATLEKMHDQVTRLVSVCCLGSASAGGVPIQVGHRALRRCRVLLSLSSSACAVLATTCAIGQNAQMRRIDDDLDEMDTALSKANKEVDNLGAGFAKGFAKDVASASKPRMFGGKKKQDDKAAAARAMAEQERREKEARDARYAEERAAKSTGASHMASAAATSKFGSKGVRTQCSCRSGCCPQGLTHTTVCTVRSRARSGTDQIVSVPLLVLA